MTAAAASASAQQIMSPVKGLTCNDIHYCIICGNEFKTSWNLKKHITLHVFDTENRFQCSNCIFNSADKYTVKRHIKHIHKGIGEVKEQQFSYATKNQINLLYNQSKHFTLQKKNLKYEPLIKPQNTKLSTVGDDDNDDDDGDDDNNYNENWEKWQEQQNETSIVENKTKNQQLHRNFKQKCNNTNELKKSKLSELLEDSISNSSVDTANVQNKIVKFNYEDDEEETVEFLEEYIEVDDDMENFENGKLLPETLNARQLEMNELSNAFIKKDNVSTEMLNNNDNNNNNNHNNNSSSSSSNNISKNKLQFVAVDENSVNDVLILPDDFNEEHLIEVDYDAVDEAANFEELTVEQLIEHEQTQADEVVEEEEEEEVFENNEEIYAENIDNSTCTATEEDIDELYLESETLDNQNLLIEINDTTAEESATIENDEQQKFEVYTIEHLEVEDFESTDNDNINDYVELCDDTDEIDKMYTTSEASEYDDDVRNYVDENEEYCILNESIYNDENELYNEHATLEEFLTLPHGKLQQKHTQTQQQQQQQQQQRTNEIAATKRERLFNDKVPVQKELNANNLQTEQEIEEYIRTRLPKSLAIKRLTEAPTAQQLQQKPFKIQKINSCNKNLITTTNKRNARPQNYRRW